MTLKRPQGPAGTVMTLEHVSRVLADNPLGDPHVRKLSVWLPPQYDQGQRHASGRRFPVLFDLVGFTGSGASHLNWKPFEGKRRRAGGAARSRAQNGAGHHRVSGLLYPAWRQPVHQFQRDRPLCRLPHAGTGAVRRFGSFERWPRANTADASASPPEVTGRSSTACGNADCWGAVRRPFGRLLLRFLLRRRLAQHARCAGQVPRAPAPSRPHRCAPARTRLPARGLDDGRVRRFLEAFDKRRKPSEADVHCIMNLCMAASYDPDPRAPNGFRLPFNLETGERLEARWRRWLEHDPINLVQSCRANLKTLKGIFIDCGWRDQYRLHYGARILSQASGRGEDPAPLRRIRRHPLQRRLPDGCQPAVTCIGP